MSLYMYSAYLIVVCDIETNAVTEVTIWSSPEWQQSRCLHNPTYVAYETKGASFHEATVALVKAISDPRSRYHWLFQRLETGKKELAHA